MRLMKHPIIQVDLRGFGPFFNHKRRGIGRYLNFLEQLCEQPEGDFAITEMPILGGSWGKPFLCQHLAAPLGILGASRDVKLLHFPAQMHPPVWVPRPYVVTVHDLIQRLFEQEYRQYYMGRRPFQYDQRVFFETISIKRALHIITPSEATKRSLTEHFEVSPERITSIPLGIDELFREPPSEKEIDDVRRSLNLPDRFLLFVGGIDPRKNIQGLFRIYARFRAKYPEVKLIFVGSVKSNHRSLDFDQWRDQAGVRPSELLLLDYVPDSVLRVLYSQAIAFVNPSLYEGFGIPAVEAMALGCPVLVYDVGATREVCGKYPLYAPEGDETKFFHNLCRVVEDAPRWEKLRDSARDHALSYTWEATRQLHLQVYSKLLDR